LSSIFGSLIGSAIRSQKMCCEERLEVGENDHEGQHSRCKGRI
jgi:hypothetical protein